VRRKLLPSFGVHLRVVHELDGMVGRFHGNSFF
jgi:hypothetical protein